MIGSDGARPVRSRASDSEPRTQPESTEPRPGPGGRAAGRPLPAAAPAAESSPEDHRRRVRRHARRQRRARPPRRGTVHVRHVGAGHRVHQKHFVRVLLRRKEQACVRDH
eukprot:743455-Hanusia_phi.AAC.3